ncbi:MAG: carbon starvation CstA family protein, partial [Candidatus Binatia bacterium]
MDLRLLTFAAVAALVLGYRFYGRFIAAQYQLDDRNRTPAVRLNDGQDY